MEDTIKILGARVHNLKNVDLEIPRRKLVVVTGLSGSGKSSLAFDTIYAEGQRRYMETLSTYARQFVGTMERPDVDKITGLSPVVAIEQKTTNKNPRSTVGTVTEINDFLRLLYARASRAYSPVTGEEMVHYTDDQIAELILTGFAGRKIALMAPIVKGRKGHYRELFESLAKKGYIYARIDGEIREISSGMRLDRYKIHTIDLVVDRLVVSEESRERLMTSLKESMRQIMNPAFNVGMWDGTADITLPYIKGYVPPYYVTIINYTVSDLQGYITEQTHEGWMVTFSTSLFSASTYTFTFEIFSRTGGATLTITNPWYNPVQYTGSISQLY